MWTGTCGDWNNYFVCFHYKVKVSVLAVFTNKESEARGKNFA